MDKSELRRHFISVREAMSAEQVAMASQALCRRLSNSPLLPRGARVLSYLAFRNELDLGLLRQLRPDVSWALPRIVGPDLVIHPYDPARLVRHPFGMLEPAADLEQIDPATLDLVLVPGVAFSRRGIRLGFGGGYYDRFLRTTPAHRIGILYDCCLTATLPHHDHDQWMDWLVTPVQTVNCLAVRERE